jgi:hypothetical protein
MSDTTRDLALALCPHELRCAYTLITAAKERLIDLSQRKLNDQPGISDDLSQLDAYLSKGVDLVKEIKQKMGVRG